MSNRVVESNVDTVPEIPADLERILLFALDEAKTQMSEGADLIPFTALVVKDNVFIESHPGEDADECFAAAEHTVKGARGASGYAFCYDGFVETDAGTEDALIAEGGVPGEDTGYAVCYLYKLEDDLPQFESEVVYVGEAPNFMGGLNAAESYAEDEIDARYLQADDSED